MPSDIPDPTAADAGYGFTFKDAERVGRTVRTVERQIKSRPGGRGRWPVGAGGAASVVTVALTGGGGIAARSTGTGGFQAPGSASVQLLNFDGSFLSVPIFSLPVGSGGSGYTDGTYALGVSGGSVRSGFDAQGTFTVVGGAVTTIRITDGGQYLPGGSAPTITFPGAGGSGATIGTIGMGQFVTCYNIFGTAVGATKYIEVGTDANGRYLVLAEDC